MDTPDPLPISRIELERIQVAVSRSLSSASLDSIASSVRADFLDGYFSRDVTLTFRAFLYGNGRETWKCEWPADWWQHFKKRWFPRWALRRWPVRMEKREGVVFQRVCPHMAIHQNTPHLAFLAGFDEPRPTWSKAR